MKINNELNNKLITYIKKYYPYILFFGLMLFLHLFMGFLGDDLKFSRYLTHKTLIEYLTYRYFHWSSRLIIESFLVNLTRHSMYLWAIIDTALYTIGVYYIIRLVNRDNNRNVMLFGLLLFLMYPFYDMASAGWMSTSLNYSWCFAFGMISFIPLIKRSYDEKINVFTYIIAILGLLYASNQEQACTLIFGFNILYMMNDLIRKRKVDKYNILALIVSSASLIFILTCPGNHVRFSMEIVKWYPEFAGFGIMEKMYLGTIPTIGILLRDKMLFAVFYIILNALLLVKNKNRNLRYVLYFNMALMVLMCVFKTLMDVLSVEDYLHLLPSIMDKSLIITALSPVKAFLSLMPLIYDSLSLFTYKGIPETLNLSAVATIVVSIYLLVSSCVMLYRNYGGNDLFPTLLFMAGFISSLIIGFSPSVFVSGPRTTIFFYIILITLTLMLIKKLYDDEIINTKWETIILWVFIILAGLSYIIALGITIVMY